MWICCEIFKGLALRRRFLTAKRIAGVAIAGLLLFASLFIAYFCFFPHRGKTGKITNLPTMRRTLSQMIPIGTSQASAKKRMEEEEFSCTYERNQPFNDRQE